MKAAVLCPGPSLVGFPGREEFDVVIGVNRAARVQACDYWVMLDAHVFREFGPPQGRPIVVSTALALRHAGILGEGAVYEHMLIDAIKVERKRPAKWDTLSATTALALAAHVGAAEIVCWGVDWQGTQDWDGFADNRQCRHEIRWGRERALWAAMLERLAALGVKVERRPLMRPAEQRSKETCHA